MVGGSTLRPSHAPEYYGTLYDTLGLSHTDRVSHNFIVHSKGLNFGLCRGQ